MEEVEMPEPDEVPRRLGELGLTVELLREAVRRGQHAADFCTASHPVFYPGTVAYAETVAGLRDATAALGWTFDDQENIPRTVSPDGAVVLTAVSGNQHTGMRSGAAAQTRRPRGAAGMRIVRRNGQLEFLELLPAEERVLGAGEVVTLGPMWFLLFFRDGDTVRSELSCARGVSDTGSLIVWRERLILPDVDLLDAPAPGGGVRPDDGGPEVVVPVVRRSA